jgi:hypothetical protein
MQFPRVVINSHLDDWTLVTANASMRLASYDTESKPAVGNENSGYEAVEKAMLASGPAEKALLERAAVERPAVVNVVEESALVVSGPEVNPAISGLLASVAARNAGDGVLPTNSCSAWW